jgi:hypothetical protein
MLATNKPIPNRNTNHRPHQRPRVINRTRINRQHRRERQEDQNVHDIYQRKQIDRDAPAAELEGAVDRLPALQLADQHEEDRDPVRDVQRDGGEGDERIEGGGGGDIDEGEEAADHADEAEGVDRDFEAWVDLDWGLVSE